jgi:methionyl-tRNA formyltransferase
LRVVFMGTPQFAVPSLQALAQSKHQVLAAISQPDRRQGRGMRLVASPVKQTAEKLGIPVLQPEKINQPEFMASLAALAPEVIVVVAYGQFIPAELLNLPEKGCINIHPSLLPRYRGATPIQHAILNGDEVTGVTTMYLDEGLDTGDLIFQQQVRIDSSETAGQLQERLSHISPDVLLRTLNAIEANGAPRLPQDERLSSYCSKLSRQDGQLNWEKSSRLLANQVRAFTPWPGTFTYHHKERVKVLQAQLGPNEDGLPGTLRAIVGETLCVHCATGTLILTTVQPENGKPMSGAAYARGRQLVAGDSFCWNTDKLL